MAAIHDLFARHRTAGQVRYWLALSKSRTAPGMLRGSECVPELGAQLGKLCAYLWPAADSTGHPSAHLTVGSVPTWQGTFSELQVHHDLGKIFAYLSTEHH